MKYATSGYFYRSGPHEFGKSKSKASTGIAVNDALKNDSGDLAVLTAGAKAQGVALEAKSVSDSATTAIKFIKAMPGRTKFVGTTKAGTLAAADLHSSVDLSGTTGAMGIAADTTTNGDFTIDEIISTGAAGQAVLYFADPYQLNATN